MGDSMSKAIFNENTLMAWSQVDPENWKTLVNEISNLFLNVGPVQLHALKTASKNGQRTEIVAAAHTLKSSCGNIGAELAHQILQQIEMLGSEGDLNQIRNLIDSLEPILEESIYKLDNFVKLNQAA